MSDRESFSSIDCALCAQHKSSRKGEHVLPQFLLRALFPEDRKAGYYTEVNGVREVSRVGAAKSSPSITRRQLPVCNETTGGDCNDRLAARFERPRTQEVVLRFFADPPGILSASDVDLGGLWWLKTLLLSAHPETRGSDGRDLAGWESPDPALFSWMIDGSDPPDWLSVWVAILDDANSDEFDPVDRPHGPSLDLPHFSAEGTQYTSRSYFLGLKNLRFHLAHHPAWMPVHPFEGSGEALRLWPPQNRALDLSAATRLGPGRAHEFKNLFGIPMGLFLEEGYDPFRSPWRLGPGWQAIGLPGVRGGTWG